MTAFKTVLVLAILILPRAASADVFDHEHTSWTEILQRFVTNDDALSHVNYLALKDEPAALERYLHSVSSVSQEQFDEWTATQQLAFLINAYNAFTVKLIVDNYPVNSIKDLGGWFSSPFKHRFIRLLDDERHLDDIEHGMIRKDFEEPRIHFALNCASRGCPSLRTEAYVATRLDQQLESNTRMFLRDNRRNRYLSERSTLELSPLLKWYREDFAKNNSSLLEFVASRISDDPSISEAIRAEGVSVRFLKYDWSLNLK